MKIKRLSGLFLVTLQIFSVLSCTQAIVGKDPMLFLVNSPFTRSKKGVMVQLFDRDLCGKKGEPRPCKGSLMQPVSEIVIEAGFEGFDWKTTAVTDKDGQAFISFENLPLTIILSDQARFMVHAEVDGKKLQEELRLSKDRLTEIRVALEVPPRLVTSLSFSDSNGNNLLDAKESGEITLKIKNQGHGIAKRVFVLIKPEKEYHDILFDETALKGVDVGDLKPGQEATLRFKINAGEMVESGSLSLIINTSEANGYDAGMVSLSLDTKAIARPNLVVARIGIDDSKGNADGIIDLGDLVDVKVIAENRGEGKAEKVLARISTDDPTIKLFETEHQLGDLEPGSSAPINFSFSTTRRYSGGKRLPIVIDFLPKRKLFEQRNQPVGLALGETTPGISSVVIGARELPPKISYIAVLEDTNNNKVLEGEEKVTLGILIENTGSGPAKGVQVILSGNKRLIELLGGDKTVGDIPAGGKKEVILAGVIPSKIPEQRWT